MLSLEGTKAILQSRAPSVSFRPVKIAVPRWSQTMIVSVLNVTVHLASQSGPIPISVCLKPGITWTVCGKSEVRCGRLRVDVLEEFWVFLVAIPTVIGVDLQVKFMVGASGGK